ncbi:MAG: hypothetical protein GY723_22365 [bacterium]|nr:hypothetical protein [bacterium]MCP5067658.1 hypothetical protein [bacterium]
MDSVQWLSVATLCFASISLGVLLGRARVMASKPMPLLGGSALTGVSVGIGALITLVQPASQAVAIAGRFLALLFAIAAVTVLYRHFRSARRA